ncbi:MAG: endolytic transglycosylase MltG [Myxococcales bacterium]
MSSWFGCVYPRGDGPGAGHDVELSLDPSESTETLTQKLSSSGLVASPRLFALYVRLLGGAEHVASGRHLVTDDVSPRELLARLERRGARVRVTFPEGWTRFDMARRLQEKHVCSWRGFLDATTAPALLRELRIEGDSAEGFLFPATYDLALNSDGADVVRRMKTEFDHRYATLVERHASGLLDLQQSLGWGTRQVLTLASVVEKEAAVDEERPLVASVFLNRLRDVEFKPKLLQSDPTSAYGCLVMPDRIPSCASFTGKITPALNQDGANPYSTYRHEGLPPGPIANPGQKSIDAVLAPARSRFLYFVARGEGRHVFSETYSAHSAAIPLRGGK